VQLRAVITWSVAAAVVVGAVAIAEYHAEPRTGDGVTNWVVEAGAYSRSADGDTFSVICVPAGDLALPYSQRSRWREIKTDRATSYNAHEGDPCPHGPLVGGSR
jgi:hypothetical protein